MGNATAIEGTPDKREKQAVSPEVLAMVKETGEAATRRLHALLADDTAFGEEGWLNSREQLRVILAAQDRHLGRPYQPKPGDVSLTQINAGQGDVVQIVRAVYEAMEADLPERIGRERGGDVGDEGKVIEAEVEVTPATVEDAKRIARELDGVKPKRQPVKKVRRRRRS
jgi:hypothetical protein